MTRPLVTIHNIEIDEIITREMNDEEFSNYISQKKLDDETKAKESSKDAAKQAVLDKLGLSADEVAALLG